MPPGQKAKPKGSHNGLPSEVHHVSSLALWLDLCRGREEQPLPPARYTHLRDHSDPILSVTVHFGLAGFVFFRDERYRRAGDLVVPLVEDGFCGILILD